MLSLVAMAAPLGQKNEVFAVCKILVQVEAFTVSKNACPG
jgi:hypothetical protein